MILNLAYILGLLSTATAWGKFAVLGLGIAAAPILPRFWRSGPKRQLWVAAGIVGFLASLYFQARMPQPTANDISKFIPTTNSLSQIVTVEGVVDSNPRLTRSQKAQFWLKATKLQQVQNRNDTPAGISQSVSGKLYVTVPLLSATGIHPGMPCAVTGYLYKPKPALNPGGFDFKAYLAREGGFAILSGRTVSTLNSPTPPRWGLWAIRQRIIRSQVNWLGSPEGQLVSSMVLGSRAVDLPYDIHDQFRVAGLSHALAASGFQVSLILGVVLALSRNLSRKSQFTLGTIALVFFVGLTGAEPPVVRAAVMGAAALVALVMQRKRKLRGLLLVATTILLLFNPLWIWDLGFQLSFLATLGLLVTATPLMKHLDWLPPAIASSIAIPIAATLWTLPLQVYVFSIVATYSLPANIIATPFITLISIGGFISALFGLIWPMAGSALAWLLYYPTHWLIDIVQLFCWLPGNDLAVGRISLLQLIIVYGLIVLVWLLPGWHRRWWLAAVVALAIVAFPWLHTNLTLFRVTVLAARFEQVMVIQDQGKVLLVNGGDADTARFTVLPFLEGQGVNQIDCAVALDAGRKNSWLHLLKEIPVKALYLNQAAKDIPGQAQNLPLHAALGSVSAASPGMTQPLPVGKTIQVNSTAIKLISAEPPVLLAEIQGQTWLMLGRKLEPDEQQQVARELPRARVLYWSGAELSAELLDAVQPEVAIASSATVDYNTLQNLQRTNTKLYYTERDGAIGWTPPMEFEPTLSEPPTSAI